MLEGAQRWRTLLNLYRAGEKLGTAEFVVCCGGIRKI